MNRVCLSILACALPLAAQTVRIIQTNAAGDEAHLIDPATNKVTLRIPNLEAAHGVVAAPDGSRIYFTVESDSTVKASDSKTGKLLGSVKLSGHPNNLTIGKDGRYVFAGISQAPGAIDVIDTQTMKNVKSIAVNGGIHNVYMSPDGKYAISGSIGTNVLTVVDAKTFEKVWELKMSAGIRPFTIEAGPDGSTSRVFVPLRSPRLLRWISSSARKSAASSSPKPRSMGRRIAALPTTGWASRPTASTWSAIATSATACSFTLCRI